jgi:hypothetical protein
MSLCKLLANVFHLRSNGIHSRRSFSSVVLRSSVQYFSSQASSTLILFRSVGPFLACRVLRRMIGDALPHVNHRTGAELDIPLTILYLRRGPILI